MATLAAKMSVAVPMMADTSAAAGASSKRGKQRAMRYTPAVTIVAAWIRAETGVGPSMASGSHVWRGSCADLANAPTRIIRQAATSCGSFSPKTSGARSNTPKKSSEPVASKSRKAPITRPTSPITLITNALIPAAVAVERRYQNEISR